MNEWTVFFAGVIISGAAISAWRWHNRIYIETLKSEITKYKDLYEDLLVIANNKVFVENEIIDNDISKVFPEMFEAYGVLKRDIEEHINTSKPYNEIMKDLAMAQTLHKIKLIWADLESNKSFYNKMQLDYALEFAKDRISELKQDK